MAASRSASVDGGEAVIMVVEDEDAIRGVISDILRYAGYTVLTARNGAEAMQLAPQGSGAGRGGGGFSEFRLHGR